MNFPGFFDQVLRITLRDPLANLLGSVTGGLMNYGYVDAVRLGREFLPNGRLSLLARRTGHQDLVWRRYRR